ncbi:MAG: class I SAM-dependent methyltransferase [Thermodesulfobacteriota bacterium]
MARTKPFEDHSIAYEDWFDRNRFVYDSELLAVKAQLPGAGKALEIGVGSGRFAAPLNIEIGVEPSAAMRSIARDKGITVIGGIAEALPFKESCFDVTLMVTTICFVDSVESSMQESYRVLKQGGSFVVGFIDKDSLIGRTYLKKRDESLFYGAATFYSLDQIVDYLKKTGFRDLRFSQTVFRPLQQISAIEPVKDGYGEGSFVVVNARK